jgi:hypothetical protein
MSDKQKMSLKEIFGRAVLTTALLATGFALTGVAPVTIASTAIWFGAFASGYYLADHHIDPFLKKNVYPTVKQKVADFKQWRNSPK